MNFTRFLRGALAALLLLAPVAATAGPIQGYPAATTPYNAGDLLLGMDAGNGNATATFQVGTLVANLLAGMTAAEVNTALGYTPVNPGSPTTYSSLQTFSAGASASTLTDTGLLSASCLKTSAAGLLQAATCFNPAAPGAIGGTTPAAGAFTTLSASGAVSGAGFTNLFAAPPAIGGTTPAPVSASTLTVTGLTNQSCLGTSAAGLLQTGTCSGALAGRLIGVQVFTASGTYTPDSGTNSVIVYATGGGGSGGGIPATSTGQGGIAVAGTPGSWAIARYTSAFSGVAVTIGAAGTVASGAAGGNGTNTSFGALLTCPGGVGGAIGVVSSTAAVVASTFWGTSPTGSGIIVSGLGERQGNAIQVSTSPLVQWVPTTAINELFGSAYGEGGAGQSTGASAAATVGTQGGAGLIIVYEYS